MVVFSSFSAAKLKLPVVLAAVLAGLLSVPAQAPAQAAPAKDTSPHSEASLVSETTSIQPGKPFTVALRLKMEDHWHAYWHNPGDSGTPIGIKWQLPKGFKAGAIQWPYPGRIELPPLVSYGYEHEVWLPVQITPPKDLKPTAALALNARAEWLVCKQECVPAFEQIALKLPVKAAAPAVDARWQTKFSETRALLPTPAAALGYQPVALRGKKVGDAAQNNLILRLKPASALPIPAENLKDIHFYAGDASTIAHAKPQVVTDTADGLQIELSPSEYSFEPVKRLRGVLLAPAGQGWDAAKKVRAISVDVPVSATAPVASAPANGATAAGSVAGAAGSNDGSAAPLSMGLALLLALGGGLLLNLMPCVFPVLSLKILSFVQQSEHDKGMIRRHGFAFGAGVLVSFWVLAASLLLVRAAGGGVGWGFQLQSPIFVAGLALLLFGVSLNLLGAFEVGVGLTSLGGANAGKPKAKGYGGSFASGVLATVVATPCTAPFMGAALGYALTQPPASAMLVFTALGIGVALPYMLLSLNPSWLKVLPRPGAWMETLKQFMAFPMFATALWLVWVFGLQTGVNGVAMLLGGFLLLGMAVWLFGRWSGSASGRTRFITRTLAAGSAVLALFVVYRGSAELPDAVAAESAPAGGAATKVVWQPFSAAKVAELRAAGKPVFVDFTAAWCITCQVNKKVTLARQDVLEAFARRGVTLMRADWTRRDPEITKVLEGFGRSGVPVYALYKPNSAESSSDSPPHLLPEVLSEPVVMEALQALPETQPVARASAGELPSRQASRPTTLSALPAQ